MTVNRTLIASQLNQVLNTFYEYPNVWSANEPENATAMSSVLVAISNVRQAIAVGTSPTVQPDEAQMIYSLVRDIEKAKEGRGKAFADALQNISDALTTVLIDNGAQPAGPHGEYRFPKK